MKTIFTKIPVYIQDTSSSFVVFEKRVYSLRYASLTTKNFILYKGKKDSGCVLMFPCETIIGCTKEEKKRAKKYWLTVLFEDGDPLLIGHETKEACDKMCSALKKCRNYELLENWLVDGSKIQKEEVIGSGAFGTVWKGKMSGTPVAIKEMYSSLTDDLINEIILLGKVKNPNCVRLLGIYRDEEDKKRSYLVTELVDVGDLTHVIRNKSNELTEYSRIKIMRDVARAVTFLHENGIIHRDLKTDNCLIRSIDPNAPQLAVLGDFGLSKFIDNKNTRNGGTNTINPTSHSNSVLQTTGLGTPVYMAPECFQDNYTTKVDVYSFGVVMNELFSEERPWDHLKNAWNHEIHNAVESGQRPRQLISLDKYPHANEIKHIINLCWEHDVNNRPDMSVILEKLENLLLEIEVPTKKPFNTVGPNVMSRPKQTISSPKVKSFSISARSNRNISTNDAPPSYDDFFKNRIFNTNTNDHLPKYDPTYLQTPTTNNNNNNNLSSTPLPDYLNSNSTRTQISNPIIYPNPNPNLNPTYTSFSHRQKPSYLSLSEGNFNKVQEQPAYLKGISEPKLPSTKPGYL